MPRGNQDSFFIGIPPQNLAEGGGQGAQADKKQDGPQDGGQTVRGVENAVVEIGAEEPAGPPNSKEPMDRGKQRAESAARGRTAKRPAAHASLEGETGRRRPQGGAHGQVARPERPVIQGQQAVEIGVAVAGQEQSLGAGELRCQTGGGRRRREPAGCPGGPPRRTTGRKSRSRPTAG